MGEVLRAELAEVDEPARGLLPGAVPVSETRSDRGPARRRRDGEPGPDHVRAADQSRQAGHRYAAVHAPRRGGRGARVRPPLVRRSGDHCLVGRPVAQRSVRHLGHAEDAGTIRARLGRVGGRHPQRLRRHHLQQGRGGDRHVRGVGRGRAVPQGRQALPDRARRRQRDGEGIPRGHLGRIGQGRGDPVFDLPRSRRRSAGDREARLRGRQGSPDAVADAIRADRGGAGARAGLAGPGLRADQRRTVLYAFDRQVRRARSRRLPAVGGAQRGRFRLLPQRAR